MWGNDRHSFHSHSRMYPAAGADFSAQISVPSHAVGAIIGKGGKTIKTMQSLPGIVSVRVINNITPTCSTVNVSGVTKDAVDRLTDEVNKLVLRSISTSAGYYPDFCTICLREEASNRSGLIELQRLPREACRELQLDTHELLSDTPDDRTYYLIKPCCKQEKEPTPQICKRLDKEVANSSSSPQLRTKVVPYVGFSSYKDDLMDCLSKIMVFGTSADNFTTRRKRKVSLLIRLGKQVYRGRNESSLVESVFSMQNFKSMIERRDIRGRFAAFYTSDRIQELESCLLSSSYEKFPRTCKILVHLLDTDSQTKYTVSLRPQRERPEELKLKSDEVKRILQCKDFFEVLSISHCASELEIRKAYRRIILLVHPDKNREPAAVVVCRAVKEAYDTVMDTNKRARHLKTLPRRSLVCDTDDCSMLEPRPRVARFEKSSERHGFVLFVGDSGGLDLRMGVKSKEKATVKDETKVLQWIEKAWDNRSADGALVFDQCESHLRVDQVRYKETSVYSSDHHKINIANVSSADTKNIKRSCICEVAVKSWWVKDVLSSESKWRSVEPTTFLTHVEELVGEARRVSRVMDDPFPS